MENEADTLRKQLDFVIRERNRLALANTAANIKLLMADAETAKIVLSQHDYYMVRIKKAHHSASIGWGVAIAVAAFNVVLTILRGIS